MSWNGFLVKEGGGVTRLIGHGGKLFVICSSTDEIYESTDGFTWIKSGDVSSEPNEFIVYDGKVYVSCGMPDNDIFVYSGGEWIKSGDVGGDPEHMIVFNFKIYVSCGYNDVIYQFNGTSWSSVSGSIEVPTKFCEYEDELYVLNFEHLTGGVYKLSEDVFEPESVTIYFPSDICVFDGRLFVLSGFSDEIWQFNGITWSKNYDFAASSNPNSMKVYNGALYVSLSDDDQIYVYDGATWSKSGDVGVQPEKFEEFSGYLFVFCDEGEEVWIFNGATWSKSGDIGTDPNSIYEWDSKLFISCYSDDEVYVFPSYAPYSGGYSTFLLSYFHNLLFDWKWVDWFQQFLQFQKPAIVEPPPKIEWKKVLAGVGLTGACLLTVAYALSQLNKQEKNKED